MHRSKKSKKSGSNKDKKQKYRNKLEKNANKDENGDCNNEVQGVDEVEARKDKKTDQPYSVEISEIMGRYLVAAKDFRSGETILNEEAIVVGPCQGSKPLCLICYRPLVPIDDQTPTVPCEKCGWPLCGVESCIRTRKDPDSAHDHSEECKVFAAARKTNKVGQDPLDQKSLYEAIVPLRCLLFKNWAPERWKEVCRMESHDAIRKTRPNVWNTNQEKVVDMIRGPWGLREKFTEEEVHKVCGALEVNAFEVGRNGSSLRALFGPNAYLIAHDCVPNTSHVDTFEPRSKGKRGKGGDAEAGTFRLKIRTSTPVSKGDTFFLSYAYTLQGTMARREHVWQSKFFSCMCRRCADPTELGTYLSALRCPLCEGSGSQGRVLSKDPLDESTEWKCDTCGRYTVQSSSVNAIVERISAEAELLSADDVEANETFLKRYRNVLYPSHYLVVGVKHSLSQLYGKMAGYTINELPWSLLERKRDLCRELLEIFDVIEPGKSRLRGVTLYELHAPLMTMITRNLEEGKINAKKDKKELQKQLLEVCNCLEEAKEILLYEPVTSSEGSIAAAASEGLKELRKWLSTLS